MARRMADKLGYLLLFVSLVALIVVGGVLVGMLVAGRIDRLMTPRPVRRPDDDAAVAPPPSPSEDEQA
jgi:hypothetical protein